jgi:hypothetical protein
MRRREGSDISERRGTAVAHSPAWERAETSARESGERGLTPDSPARAPRVRFARVGPLPRGGSVATLDEQVG